MEESASTDKSGYFQRLADLKAIQTASRRSKGKFKSSERLFSSLLANTTGLSGLLSRKTGHGHSYHHESLDILYASLWSQWKSLVCAGYNLVFYGYGSKQRHLDCFVREMFSMDGWHALTVSCYHAELELRQLKAMINEVMNRFTNQETTINDDEYSSKTLSKSSNDSMKVEDRKILLVLHSMDSEGMSDLDDLQDYILALPSWRQGTLRIIGSVDKVPSGGEMLGMDKRMANRWPTAFLELTTLEPFDAELAYEHLSWQQWLAQLNLGICHSGGIGNGILGPGGNATGITGMKHVLASLTANVQRLFAMALGHQLASRPVLSLQRLYVMGRNEFLLSNEAVFRSMLREFLDHRLLVVVQHSASGATSIIAVNGEAIDMEWLVRIPLEAEMQKQLMLYLQNDLKVTSPMD